MKRILVISFGLANLLSLSAQEQKPAATVPDPYEWTVRVYRFPADEMKGGFVSRDRGQMHAPPMPAANASAEELKNFIKSSNDVVTQYLMIEGVPLAKGSLAVVDVVHDMLVVRTLNSTHDQITGLAQAFINRLPQYLSFNTHIVEGDVAVIRQLVKDAPQNADQKALFERMQALVTQGQARFINTLNVDTRSGQRASVSGVAHRSYAEGFSVDERDSFEIPASTRDVGTKFEVDPVIGPDAMTIDVNFALDYDFASPTERWEPAAQSGQRRIETRVTDFHRAKMASATTILSGMTKLLGAWRPDPVPNKAEVMQAAFLKGVVVPLMPLSDTRAEQILRAQGEAVEATPPKPKALPNEGLPPGMILRRFRVPPNFLTSAGGASAGTAAPVDPFTSLAPPRDEPRAMRAVTALDVLQANGIPFPKGSSVNFSRVAGELIVRNTPENIKLVEAIVEDLSSKAPLVLGVTVQVVQADGALLRRLGAEMSVLSNHADAWKAVEDAAAQGKAKILHTGWVETRSGQRSSIRVGTEYMHAGSPYIGRMVGTATKPDAKADAKVGEAAPAPKSSSDGTRPVVSVDHEVEEVGFLFEIDPVIGPDGETIDINVALTHDTAPPTPRFVAVGGAEKVLRAELPGTDFHKAGMSTALTLKNGATRFLGVWKPEGSPEFENADVLQAGFVKVDLIEVHAEVKK